MSWGVSPWVWPVWDSWVPRTWVITSFPILGKFSTIISSSIFSWSFFLSSSSGTPMIRMLECLALSWRSLRLSSFLLIRFSFFLSNSFISAILSSNSLILSSASVILFVASRVFFISFIALLIICWFFFIYSRSLLNIYCIFSILVSKLFFCDSIFVFKILYHFHYRYLEFFIR